jgi:lipoate-protein ligase A
MRIDLMSAAVLSRKANDLKNRVRMLKNATTSGNLTPQQMISLVALLSETIDVVDGLLNGNNDVVIRGDKIVGSGGRKVMDN